MDEGKWYVIRYKQQGGNYQWSEYEVTAQYLGTKPDGMVALSLRPMAGTAELHKDHILSSVLAIKPEPKMHRRIGKFQNGPF